MWAMGKVPMLSILRGVPIIIALTTNRHSHIPPRCQRKIVVGDVLLRYRSAQPRHIHIQPLWKTTQQPMPLANEVAGAFEHFHAQITHGGLLALFGVTRQQRFLGIARPITRKGWPLACAQCFLCHVQQLEPGLVPCFQGDQACL